MPTLLRCLAIVAALSAVSTAVLAVDIDQVPAPAFKVGDALLYDQIVEKRQTGFDERRLNPAVENIGGDTMTIGIKRDGAPVASQAHVVGAGWSQRRLVDGRQTVTTRPLQLPMRVGRDRSVASIDSTRRGNQLSAHVQRTYAVVGRQDVDVPAGHFTRSRSKRKASMRACPRFPIWLVLP